MRKPRRKTLRRFIERAAVAVLALDAVVYAAVVRPLSHRVASAQESYDQTRLAVLDAETRLARLERQRASLPETADSLRAFLADHVPARRWGFSQAEQLVDRLTRKSNVQLVSVSYKLKSSTHQPLDQLGIQITVTGSFAELLQFAHDIETAKDLILVRDFNFTASGARNISLTVDADLYLTP
jgi:Tfp pilus assembly protein PilO